MNQSRDLVEIGQAIPALVAEARARRVPLAVLFAAIATALLLAGLLWPRSYVSSTTILVQEDNIIQPLMEGRAVPTSVTDRARIAREVIFGQRILDEILAEGGWVGEDTAPMARDLLKERLKERTRVSTSGPNLISIVYRDDDPVRAYRITARYAELFIAESLAAKERESREAYEFIASRVAEYHAKLVRAEENLKLYRAENQDARPGSQADVETRVTQLRGNIETARTALSELQMREAALVAQLSGEAQVSMAQTRETQTHARLMELRTELDGLLLNYTDAHPDVVRVRHQIEDLQAELARLAALGEQPGAASGSAGLVAANPLFHSLRGDLAQVRSDIAALRARVSENDSLLDSELERGRRVADSEAALAELTRDYEVNRDIYQDLLRRRENARVSMNLDAERRGLTFTVQEPAALPLRPTGLRFMHFAAAGMAAGIGLPLVLVFLLVRLDPRVRSPRQLVESLGGVPLLASIPHQRSERERRRDRWRSAFAVSLCVAVVAAYGTAAWMRLSQIG